MKYLKLTLLLISFLIALAFDKDEEQLTCCGSEISYEKEYDLSSNWSLVGIIREKPFLEECTNGLEGTIMFNKDGTFRGHSQCNAMEGNYEVSGSNHIVISNLFQTLRGSIGEESEYWEEKYTNELREADKFEIEGNKLVINTSYSIKMVFVAYEE